MLISDCQIEAQFLQVSKFVVSHLTSIPTLAVIFIFCRARLGEISNTLSGADSKTENKYLLQDHLNIIMVDHSRQIHECFVHWG